eukprot:scaffold254682_cov17-Tisochrysis_lutea.AAC.1
MLDSTVPSNRTPKRQPSFHSPDFRGAAARATLHTIIYLLDVGVIVYTPHTLEPLKRLSSIFMLVNLPVPDTLSRRHLSALYQEQAWGAVTLLIPIDFFHFFFLWVGDTRFLGIWHPFLLDVCTRVVLLPA